MSLTLAEYVVIPDAHPGRRFPSPSINRSRDEPFLGHVGVVVDLDQTLLRSDDDEAATPVPRFDVMDVRFPVRLARHYVTPSRLDMTGPAIHGPADPETPNTHRTKHTPSASILNGAGSILRLAGQDCKPFSMNPGKCNPLDEILLVVLTILSG